MVFWRNTARSFARTRQALADQAYPQGEWRTPTGAEAPGPGAPRKLYAQRQAGLFVVPVALPIGEATARQLHGIAVLLRENGLDEIHTTQDQNLIILNVPQEKLAVLRGGLALLGLHEPSMATMWWPARGRRPAGWASQQHAAGARAVGGCN